VQATVGNNLQHDWKQRWVGHGVSRPPEWVPCWCHGKKRIKNKSHGVMSGMQSLPVTDKARRSKRVEQCPSGNSAVSKTAGGKREWLGRPRLHSSLKIQAQGPMVMRSNLFT
jgi:hypothetical protein